MSSIDEQFLNSIIERMKTYKAMGDRTFEQLSFEQMRHASNESTNSIAVIAKHTAGNMLSRWTDFFDSDGEKSWRDRDSEFVDTFESREELLDYWESGWTRLFETLNSMQPADLVRTVAIRSEPHSTIEAINRQYGHYAYHIGQIVHIAKGILGDQWETLSIPKGKSEEYNRKFGSSNDNKGH